MGARMIIGGETVNITDKEYSRFKARAEKAGHGLQILQNGVVYRPDLIQAIIPDDMSMGTPTAELAPVADLFETVGHVVETLSPEVEDTPRVTPDEIKSIMESHNLTVGDLAASVAYSQASIRMAVKGDRISKELSDAIKAKYLAGDTPA